MSPTEPDVARTRCSSCLPNYERGSACLWGPALPSSLRKVELATFEPWATDPETYQHNGELPERLPYLAVKQVDAVHQGSRGSTVSAIAVKYASAVTWKVFSVGKVKSGTNQRSSSSQTCRWCGEAGYVS